MVSRDLGVVVSPAVGSVVVSLALRVRRVWCVSVGSDVCVGLVYVRGPCASGVRVVSEGSACVFAMGCGDTGNARACVRSAMRQARNRPLDSDVNGGLGGMHDYCRPPSPYGEGLQP